MSDSKSHQLYDVRGRPMSALKYDVEVAQGRIVGHYPQRKFGFNNSLNTSTYETIAPWGGRVGFLLAAETMNFASDNVEDGGGTLTGALTITIRGVDTDFNDVSEELILNGTTPVPTANQYIAINRVRVLTAGSTRANVGTITATAATALTTQAQIPPGYCTTQQVFWAVPRGFIVIIDRISITAVKLAGGGLPVVTPRIYQHSYGDAVYTSTSAVIYEEAFNTAVSHGVSGDSVLGIPLEECSIIEFAAISDTTATSVDAHVSMNLIAV